MSDMKTYTVAGLYIDDDPVVSIVLLGEHNAVDATGGEDYPRWATSVEAQDPDDAEDLAVTEMRASNNDEDDEDDEDDAP
jgi:hypothetical protein